MNRTSALAYLAIFSQGPLLLGRRLAPMCLIRCHTLCIPQQVGRGRRSWGGIVKMFWQKTEYMVKKKFWRQKLECHEFCHGVLPCLTSTRMCYWTRFGFQGVGSKTGRVYNKFVHYLAFCTGCLFGLKWLIDIMGDSDNSPFNGGFLSCLL